MDSKVTPGNSQLSSRSGQLTSPPRLLWLAVMLWRVPVRGFSTVYNENPQPASSLFLFSTASGDWSSLPHEPCSNLNPTYHLRFVTAATHNACSGPSIGLMFKVLFHQINKSPKPKGQRIRPTRAQPAWSENLRCILSQATSPFRKLLGEDGSQPLGKLCESNTVQDSGLFQVKGRSLLPLDLSFLSTRVMKSGYDPENRLLERLND